MNIALSAGVFLFLCIATEAALRIYDLARPKADACDHNKLNKTDKYGMYEPSSNADLIYELKSNYVKNYGPQNDFNDFGPKEVITNADGLREGRDYAIPKPSDTFRIVALGRSHTFGWGVKVEES